MAPDMDNLTDVNVTSRKLRKPLMERKRRARINRSLDELYQLLTGTDFAAKGPKPEKADILEMTVEYLKHVRHRAWAQETEENLQNLLLERYFLGFEKCIKEMESLVDPRLRHRIDAHLKNCLEKEKNRKGLEKSNGFLIRDPNDLRFLHEGDVLFILSPDDQKGKNCMWRPWR